MSCTSTAWNAFITKNKKCEKVHQVIHQVKKKIKKKKTLKQKMLKQKKQNLLYYQQLDLVKFMKNFLIINYILI
jgi:hypothetical protein